MRPVLLFLCLTAIKDFVVESYPQELLNYLEEFEYLPRSDTTHALISYEAIKAALRRLQKHGKISVTGEVDASTLRLINRKRCGVGDKEVFELRRTKRYAMRGLTWKKHLVTYSIDNPSRSIPNMGDVRREAVEAINSWQRVLNLRLTEVHPGADADIRIRFVIGDHGDASRFDGNGKILAHAFPPGEGIGGDVHLDDDEYWTNQLTGDLHSQRIGLRSVIAHEIGHSLGLSHSEFEDSIMYTFYQYHLEPSLSTDDIYAVQSLYGRGQNDPPRTLPQTPSTTTSKPPTATQTYQPSTVSPTQSSASPKTPDLCRSAFDAIVSIGREMLIFKNKWFWRMLEDGSLYGGPRRITSLWPEFDGTIDAAVELDHKILIFSGKHFFIYNGQKLEYIKPLTTLGLPDRVERIRLVYKWNYWPENPIYIWTDDEFWRIDKKSGRAEIGYPRRISLTWKNVPRQASAATVLKNKLYFFESTNAYEFHSVNMSASDAIPIADIWPHCSTKRVSNKPFRNISVRCHSINFVEIVLLTISILLQLP